MSDELARRDYFVERAVTSARAEGHEVNAEDVGRAAARDLNVLDRAVASGDLQTGKQERKPEEPEKGYGVDPRRDFAGKFAAQMGATMWTQRLPANEKAEPELPRAYGVEAMRKYAMERRLRLLCEPVPGYSLKENEPLGNACAYPAFANEIMMHMIGSSSGTTQGYKHLRSREDRLRKYQRAIEDICDRSDAAVGVNWWVK